MLVHYVEYYHDLIHSWNETFLCHIRPQHTIKLIYLMPLMAGETMVRVSVLIVEYQAHYSLLPLAIFSVGDKKELLDQC